MAGIDVNALLVLHCDGTDASTSFPDASQYARTVTANGNAQVDTAQSEFGGASYLGDGTGDFLSVGDDAAWDFGTGDFTIDCWVRWNSTAATGSIVEVGNGSSVGVRIVWIAGLGTAFVINNVVACLEAFTPNTGQWYHLAAVRSGTAADFFFDGGSLITGINSADITGSTVGVRVGSDQDSQSHNGWIDEVRISNVARWTTAFTPPTAPYSSGSIVVSKSRLTLLGCG